MSKVGDTVYRIKHAVILPCIDYEGLCEIAVGISEDTVIKIQDNGSYVLRDGGVYRPKHLYQTMEEAQKAFINERESNRNDEDFVRAYKLLKELFEWLKQTLYRS